jgi:hypothetical protein
MSLKLFTTGNLCTRCNALKDAMQKVKMPYTEAWLESAIISECLCETGILVQSAPLVMVDDIIYYFADDLFSPAGDLLANWKAILEGNRPPRAGFSGKAETETKKQSCSKIWKGDKI